MDIGKILSAIWNWMVPKLESQGINANEIMSEAMATGNSSQSTSAIMGVLENKARDMGKGDILANNQSWQSFKSKPLDQIIPHGMAILKEMGLFSRILAFFTGGKNETAD